MDFHTPSLHFKLISDAAAFEALQGDWEMLQQRSRGSIFISYAWCRHQFHSSPAPRIICGYHGQDLVFALPLQERILSRKFRFPSLQHLCQLFSDYHECLLDPSIDIAAFSARFWDYFRASKLPQTLAIDLLLPGSALEQILNHQPEDYRGYALPDYPTLHCAFDKLKLSSKLKRNARTRRKQLEQSHQLEIKLQQPLTEDALERALQLNQQRYGENKLNQAGSRTEVRALFQQLDESLECSYLCIDGEIAAIHVGFFHNGELLHYLTGFDNRFSRFGIGIMLLLAMLEHYQQQGLCSVNFLRGLEEYKQRVSTHQRYLSGRLCSQHGQGLLREYLLRLWLRRQHQQHIQDHSHYQRYAIVLANGLNGLGAIKSLHQARIGSLCIFPSPKDTGAASRHPAEKHYLPFSPEWETQLLELLRKLAADYRTPLPIFACSDRAANFLQNYREQLPSNVLCLVPGSELIEQLNDKSQELQLLAPTSVTLPESVAEPLGEHPFDALPLPIIIKPRNYPDYALLGAKNYIATNQAELEQFYQRFSGQFDHFIAQEVIPGGDDALWVCNATFDEQHEMISAFTFQRLGTSPSHFGVTSSAYSADNAEIKKQVAALGRTLKYIGPGMWEFKYDATTSSYYYLETNPRLGMCNWFDSACGVNNLVSSYQTLTGHCYAKLPKQKTEYYFLHTMNDLVARIEDRQAVTSMLRIYQRILSGTVVWAVYSPRDPWPAMRELYRSFSMLIPRTFKTIVRKLKQHSPFLRS
ncbi:GNAT family N-acetyltransferase [Aliagarivorans taiwanensis]|uniref:GNAT family N-acetyltransferase n=1 Tax=Aliagarivorans taiwanensis TaxID=561966 RepID=UPI000421B5E4|nr:GNAT family N-acetyltransferase [Aliagarivorans taiwanensis]